MDLSSNRDLDIEPRADIHPSHRDHEFLKDLQGPNAEGQMLELHSSIKKYKEHIARLNSQLRRYQALLPLAKLEQPKEGEEEKPEAEEAEEFVQLLADHPLIHAYEQQIEAAGRANRQLSDELELVRSQNEKLSKEAEELGQRLLEKTEQLAQCNEKALRAEGIDILGEGVTGGKEIYEILESLKKEQQVLLNEVDITKTRAIKAENDLRLQQQVAEEMEKKYKECNARCFKFESDLETATHERELLENKLNLKLAELKVAQTEREQFYNQKVRQESDIKLLQKNVEQYKGGYEDLEARKAGEIEQLEKELNEKGIALKDSRAKLLVQERELEDVRDINRKLQHDLEATKNDVAQMLKIMEDSETKLALVDEREKTLKAREQEARRRIEEAKVAKDELIQKERQYHKQLTQMEQQWKQDAEERQKKYDALIDTARSKQKAVLTQREEEYNLMSEKFGKLQASYDKLQADYRVLEEENRKVASTLGEEQKNLGETAKSYEQQLREVQRKEGDERRKLQTQADDLSRSCVKLGDQLKETEQENRNLRQQLEMAERTAKENEAESREAKASITTVQQEKENAIKEIDRLKKIHQSKCDEINEVYNMKLTTTQNEMLQSKEKFRTNEDKVYQLLKQQEAMAEKWRTEHHSSIKYFEKIIVDLNSQIRSLKKEYALGSHDVVGMQH